MVVRHYLLDIRFFKTEGYSFYYSYVWVIYIHPSFNLSFAFLSLLTEKEFFVCCFWVSLIRQRQCSRMKAANKHACQMKVCIIFILISHT